MPAYRRSGIALLMLEEAKNHLLEIGARRLRCYVEPQNTSLRLQKKAGFLEKPFENFNHLQNEGRIMLECELPLPFAVIPQLLTKPVFVFGLYAQNRTALRRRSITLSEWRELLACGDGTKRIFSSERGDAGGVYMKLNGLLNTDTAYLSMLFVAKRRISAKGIRPLCGRMRGTLPLPRADLLWLAYKRPPTTSPRKPWRKSLRLFRRASTEAERRRFVKASERNAQTWRPDCGGRRNDAYTRSVF